MKKFLSVILYMLLFIYSSARADSCLSLVSSYEKPFLQQENVTVYDNTIYVPTAVDKFLVRALVVSISMSVFDERLNSMFGARLGNLDEDTLEKPSGNKGSVVNFCVGFNKLLSIKDEEKKNNELLKLKQEWLDEYKRFLNGKVLDLNVVPIAGCAKTTEELLAMYKRRDELIDDSMGNIMISGIEKKYHDCILRERKYVLKNGE